MSRARKVAKSASARAALREALALLGPAITAGFVVAGLLVAADRLLGLGLSVWAVTAAPVGVAIGAALAVALSRRPDDVGAATTLDHALGLRDRLSSAIELSGDEQTRDDAFSQWAAEDAEAAAAGADVRRAIPLRLSGWWAVWPAVGAVVVFAAVMAPTVDIFGREASREREIEEASQREEATTQIAEATERAREALTAAQTDAAPQATSEQLRALEELEEQLASGQLSPDEARSKAAASLETIAAGAENEAARLERDLDALDERLGQVDPSSQAAPLGEEIAQALREGEFERAASLLEELQRSVGDESMSDQEREALAQDLERLAQQLESAGEGAPLEQERSVPASEAPASEPPVDDLLDQGLSPEDAERLASMSDEQALREALEQEGVAPEIADRLAEQIAQENQQREAAERAEERTEELSDALRDAADEVRDPPPPPTPAPSLPEQKPPTPPGESPPSGAPPPPSERGQEPSPQQKQEQGSGEREQPREGEGQQQKPGEQPAPQPQESPTPEGQAPQSGDRPQQQGEGEQPNTPEGMEAGEQNEQGEGAEMRDRPPGESNPGPTGGQEQDPAQPGEGQSRAGEKQQEQEGASPEGQTGGGVERAKEALQEMERQKQEAQERRGGAQQMRDEAQRLMEQASPEQREQAERWAQQAEQEAGEEGVGAGAGATGEGVRSGAPGEQRPFGTENVDVRRGSTEDGRVAAEWVDPNAPPSRNGAVGGPRTAEGVREAARSAERAMEEQSVSPRYNRVVREFFRRRLEAMEQRPAPVVPAQDVERPSAPPPVPVPAPSAVPAQESKPE